MHHIPRNGSAIPETLSKSTERTRAAQLLAQDPELASFTFKDFRADDVRSALKALFNDKCAYCDFTISRHPMEVEHFRPKGGVMIGKKLRVPGYWWLAADWNNLLPSCIDCNRRRGRIVEGGGLRMAGKANDFPLEHESNRAKKPGKERHESPLLLDPCTDDARLYLQFSVSGEGMIEPLPSSGLARKRAEITIALFGLDDLELIQMRKAVWLVLQSRLKDVSDLLEDYAAAARDSARRNTVTDRLKRKCGELHDMTLPSQPFLTMVVPIVKKTFEVVSERTVVRQSVASLPPLSTSQSRKPGRRSRKLPAARKQNRKAG